MFLSLSLLIQSQKNSLRDLDRYRNSVVKRFETGEVVGRLFDFGKVFGRV